MVGPKLNRYILYFGFGIGLAIFLCLSSIPLQIAITTHQVPHPQGILVLGGHSSREEAAAKLASQYPALDIWVSSGKMPEDAYPIFQTAGIDAQRIHLDYQATDTVTNFTTLVEDFKRHHIQHLFLVTSDFHMPRARAISTVVLGSQGIITTPVAVNSLEPAESSWRKVRDISRTLLWLMTGHTGENLAQAIQNFEV